MGLYLHEQAQCTVLLKLPKALTDMGIQRSRSCHTNRNDFFFFFSPCEKQSVILTLLYQNIQAFLFFVYTDVDEFYRGDLTCTIKLCAVYLYCYNPIYVANSMCKKSHAVETWNKSEDFQLKTTECFFIVDYVQKMVIENVTQQSIKHKITSVQQTGGKNRFNFQVLQNKDWSFMMKRARHS